MQEANNVWPVGPVRGQSTEIRRATEADAELLVSWHAEPEVARYWDGETFTRDEILERLEEPGVDSWIIEAGGKPVGHLQSWWEPGEGTTRGGLDMFLVPGARRKGLGPDAARALTQALLGAGWAEVTADPYLWNETAVRAWARAGFVPVEEREPDDEHTAAWVLMRFAD